MGEVWTLLEAQKKLGHSKIDLLKMDIEGWEIPIFYSWPELDHTKDSSQKIILPMQILVEIHYRVWSDGLHRGGGNSDFLNPIEIVELQTHFLRMGYAVIFRQDNPACLVCTELTLMRIHCPDSDLDSGVYHVAHLLSEQQQSAARTQTPQK